MKKDVLFVTVLVNKPENHKDKCDVHACETSPTITDSHRGEILCGGCGLVLLQKMEDSTHEEDRRSHGDGISQSRVGPGSSLAMHDKGLSTVIGRDIDSGGKVIERGTKLAFDRLRVWDQRSRARSLSNLSKALTQLNAMKTKMAIPDSVIEDAAYIYRKVVSAKLTRGRTMRSLIAAALYAACRQNSIPRTIGDIAQASNVEKLILSRDYRTVITRLGLNVDQYDISSFIVKISNNLKLKEKTKRDGLAILQRAEKAKITAGKSPIAQAAAALYIACIVNGERVSQKKFSRIAGVSDVTIRNNVAFLKKNIEI